MLGVMREIGEIQLWSIFLPDVDRLKCVLLILLDLSAVFDTLLHGRFLNRPENDFGVTGRARKWLESHFRERHEAVHIGSSSVHMPLTISFPHDSLIGPCGFKSSSVK